MARDTRRETTPMDYGEDDSNRSDSVSDSENEFESDYDNDFNEDDKKVPAVDAADDADDDEENEEEDIDAAISENKTKTTNRKVQTKYRQHLNEINKITTAEEIVNVIRKSFQDAQITVTSHKRQLSIMSAVMVRARDLGESAIFNACFTKMLCKILPVKKNTKSADRIVKFTASFFDMIFPHGKFEESEGEDGNDGGKREDIIDEDTYDKFVYNVLHIICQALDSVSTTIRFRACHLLSHIIPVSDLGDLHGQIADDLLIRIHDKDHKVRNKAVSAFSNFQHDEDDYKNNHLMRIRSIMIEDDNPEVRRTCMKSIVKNRLTENYIVSRSRDESSANRKFLYSKILKEYPLLKLRRENRSILLENGLKDHDKSVREAASKWLTETLMKEANYDVIAILSNIDFRSKDIGDIAARQLIEKNPDILKNVQDLILNKNLLQELTPEISVLVRVIFEYCQDEKKSDYIENVFPEASTIASLFEKYFALRVEHQNRLDAVTRGQSDTEEGIQPQEFDFIIKQLLKIAVNYDYSDEYGRNQVFTVLRTKLSEQSVDVEILPELMECLRKLAVNERDFCRVGVEIINEIKDAEYEKIDELKRLEKAEMMQSSKNTHRRTRSGTDTLISKLESLNTSEDSDSDSDSDEYHSAMNDISAVEAEKSRQIELNQVKELPSNVITYCLNITKCMLELIFVPMKKNELLISLFDNFIVPCINERKEIEARALALKCHALCGILDKETAISSMTIAAIFMTRVEIDTYHEIGLQVMGDLLAVHGTAIVTTGIENSVDTEVVAKLFYRHLRNEKRPKLQVLSAITIFKLLLSKIITEPDFFENAILTYFDPKINKNNELRNCLNFGISSYVFSHENHQQALVNVVYDILERIYEHWDKISLLNKDLPAKHRISVTMIVENILLWTDPYNRAGLREGDLNEQAKRESSNLHIEVGIQFMRFLRRMDCEENVDKLFYKPIMRSLKNIVFTGKADIGKLRELDDCFNDSLLLKGDINEVLNSDAVCRSSFKKCHSHLRECLKVAEKAEKERIARENELKAQEGDDEATGEEEEEKLDQSRANVVHDEEPDMFDQIEKNMLQNKSTKFGDSEQKNQEADSSSDDDSAAIFEQSASSKIILQEEQEQEQEQEQERDKLKQEKVGADSPKLEQINKRRRQSDSSRSNSFINALSSEGESDSDSDSSIEILENLSSGGIAKPKQSKLKTKVKKEHTIASRKGRSLPVKKEPVLRKTSKYGRNSKSISGKSHKKAHRVPRELVDLSSE